MNFKLKYLNGVSRKKYKEWRCGDYRITWTREVCGVQVPPHFHATILRDGQWDFVERKGPYKTFNAAVKACGKHQKDRKDRNGKL